MQTPIVPGSGLPGGTRTRTGQVIAAGPADPAGRGGYDAGYNAGYNRGYDSGFDTGHDLARTTYWRPFWDVFRQTPLPVPELDGLAAMAVVPARDEERTLPIVLAQLRRLPLQATIVVVNGSTDGTRGVAEASGCRVIGYPAALGHDVARAAGVVGQDPDIWLFTDSDLPIEAEDLVPFLRAAARGVDVALNDITPFLRSDGPRHVVSVAKDFLNRALGRADLGTNSLTAVPHAMTRRAVAAVTAPRLAVPPLAHAAAILEGLTVEAVHSVDVIAPNRIHAARVDDRSPQAVERLILGDHVEALAYVVQRLGARAGFSDLLRQRDVLPSVVPPRG